MNHLQVTFNAANQINAEFNVSLEGELNNMNAINFKKDLLRLVSTENTDCTVNIEKLSAIDLTGLNALAMAHRSLEKTGKKLTVVCRKEDPIDHFLHLTKFNRFLNLQRA